MESLSKLPSQLEEMYKTCLLRTRRKKPLCDFRLLRMICVAPTPMQERALRQLLALDEKTFDYAEEALVSVEELVLSGVGLVTFDSTERIVVPIHDSVRSFIFSDSARAVMQRMGYEIRATHRIGLSKPYAASERNARVRLGYLCLRHMKRRATRTSAAPTDPDLVRLKIPTRTFSLPSVLQKALNLFFFRFPKLPTANVKFYSSHRQKTPADGGFFQYAMANWIECNRDIYAGDDRRHWSLFVETAMERDESWNIHPWPAQTPNQHRIEMFAFSVACGHLPMLQVALSHEKGLLGRVFDGPLANHGQLPSLHVACKKGHIAIVRYLCNFCDLEARCQPQGRIALHYAAEFGHLDCCRMVARAAQWLISARDMRGLTPLHLATQSGQQQIVEFLLQEDNTTSFKTDHRGLSPLEYAFRSNNWHIVHSLASAIEQIESQQATRYLTDPVVPGQIMSERQLAVKIAAQHVQGRLNDRDDNGLTLLWRASATGSATVVKLLLTNPKFDEEAEMHIRDSKGATTICVACKNYHLDVIQVLLDTALHLRTLFVVEDSTGWLPMDYLAFYHEILRSQRGVRLIETANYRNAPLLDIRDQETAVGNQKTTLDRMETELTAVIKELEKTQILLGRLALEADIKTHDHVERFLQAAAEVGHVDAVKHLLMQWEGLKMTSPETDIPSNVESYIKRRGLVPHDFFSLEVSGFTFPVAIYLAAMKDHKEVLDLLLQAEEECSTSSTKLMARARELGSYPGHLDRADLKNGRGGWFPRGTDVKFS